MNASLLFFATACFSLAACGRSDAGSATAPAPSSGPASAPVSVIESVSGAGAGADAAADADAGAGADSLLTALPVSSRPIGHTSYVLKLALSSGAKAVFKPRSRLPLGDRRYRGEIAAYRLARALGLDNVPRAEARSFDASALRPLEADFDAKALPDSDGAIRGAIMPWIDRYEVFPLEQPAWRSRWEAWLTDPAATIPADDRATAEATSALVVFDALTANWDRWSGGNVARDGATGRVLFVDNDGAFYDPPPADSVARQLALVRRMVRFPRGVITALRGLDEARLGAIFGDERPGEPLLPAKVVTGVDGRRRKVLEAVDALIAGGVAAPWVE